MEVIAALSVSSSLGTPSCFPFGGWWIGPPVNVRWSSGACGWVLGWGGCWGPWPPLKGSGAWGPGGTWRSGGCCGGPGTTCTLSPGLRDGGERRRHFLSEPLETRRIREIKRTAWVKRGALLTDSTAAVGGGSEAEGVDVGLDLLQIWRRTRGKWKQGGKALWWRINYEIHFTHFHTEPNQPTKTTMGFVELTHLPQNSTNE